MPGPKGTPVHDIQRPVLRFNIDALRDAGAMLGPIQSRVIRPNCSFESLVERANDLQRRASKRNDR